MSKEEILKNYGVKEQKLSEFKSVTFKPYRMKSKSKWKVSKELKLACPFLFINIE